jgi:hypothetical protein
MKTIAMEAPRLNCHKGMLALLLLLQTAGGAMAQNTSHNRSQNTSHNRSQDKHQYMAHNNILELGCRCQTS